MDVSLPSGEVCPTCILTIFKGLIRNLATLRVVGRTKCPHGGFFLVKVLISPREGGREKEGTEFRVRMRQIQT